MIHATAGSNRVWLRKRWKPISWCVLDKYPIISQGAWVRCDALADVRACEAAQRMHERPTSGRGRWQLLRALRAGLHARLFTTYQVHTRSSMYHYWKPIRLISPCTNPVRF
jgi:hypothetical protein